MLPPRATPDVQAPPQACLESSLLWTMPPLHGYRARAVHLAQRMLLRSRVHAQERWPEHIILRSSIIYGPEGIAPVPRPLFIQFIARQLAGRTPTSFFHDEWRNSIFVDDIVAAVEKLLQLDHEQLPRRWPVSTSAVGSDCLPAVLDEWLCCMHGAQTRTQGMHAVMSHW